MLRPASAGDLAALHALWSHPSVREYLFDDEEVSIERASAVLHTCLEHASAGYGLWLVQPHDGDAVLGCVGLLPATVAAEHEPASAGLLEPLAALAPEHWHKGYAFEALTALLAHAFGTLGQPSLAAAHDVPNEASARLLERLGFAVVRDVPGRRFPLRTYALPYAAWAGRHPPSELDAVRAELLAMAAEDLRVREELAQDGALFDGYHPRMREVHERNAARLEAILDRHGWLGRSLVGDAAADAAWLVLQHAIGNPALQRRGLAALTVAAAAGEALRLQVAMLEDRIRCNEGRGQRYGTQLDWDEHGLLSPLPIEDEAGVDARRAELGLSPLADHVRRKRELAEQSGERPPSDWHARERSKEEWLRQTGWRK